MEFIVLSHRDSKDVFILGGTDDTQVLLDDSQVGGDCTGGLGEAGRAFSGALTLSQYCVFRLIHLF